MVPEGGTAMAAGLCAAWVLHVHRRARRDATLVGKLEARTTGAAVPATGDRVLAAALALLGERDREALLLIAWEGLSVSEAAVVVGCSRAAFAVRLHRARRIVRGPRPRGDWIVGGGEMNDVMERLRAANPEVCLRTASAQCLGVRSFGRPLTAAPTSGRGGERRSGRSSQLPQRCWRWRSSPVLSWCCRIGDPRQSATWRSLPVSND